MKITELVNGSSAIAQKPVATDSNSVNNNGDTKVYSAMNSTTSSQQLASWQTPSFTVKKHLSLY